MLEEDVPRSPSRRRFSAVLAAATSLSLAALRPAAAHAILVASQPAIDASIPAGHVRLQLRYNSRIDRERSRLTLTRPDHTQTVLAIAADGPPDELSAEAELAPGAYTVRWQVLAVDGHITRGLVPFAVTEP